MDTSSPAVFVNAELLKMHVGRRVRIVLQVTRIEGGVMIGQSTDGQQLTVKGADLQSIPLPHYVEVIGIADGNHSIRAEICTNFGENFDAVSYNGLCKLANGKFKSLFL
ncbi:replication protein A 14 kDa subunit-like [Phalaenopsis equestris]|uniref:replication protein A 14 kDa subunit-like n=1 Tax=Phalaenopsis equestris TaxID=78828 RepID=UPI0009E4A259|nr:replication protein A 14 kDa subunit-like [Phalaenopsis equestris]